MVDVAVRIYGHATGVFWLLEDNQNVRIDQEFLSETELIIRDQKVKLLELGPVKFKTLKLPKYELKERQSFFDIVVENQGTILAAFDLAKLNDYDGITEHVFTGDLVEILETAAAPRIKDALKKDMPIATISDDDKSDGIGFMRVTRNFIIR